MALMNCPECGHQVSDQAESCPNCGYILNKRNNNSTQLDKYIKYRIKSEFAASCLAIPSAIGLIIWTIISAVKYKDTIYVILIIVSFVLLVVSIITLIISYKRLFKNK